VRTAEIFDRIATRYVQAEQPVARELAEHLLRRARALAPGSRILDLGCGPGHHAVALARLGYDVTALDVSPRMLEETERRARAAGVAVETIELDVTTAEIPGSYDAACALMGPLSYVADPSPIIARIARVLAPDAPLWVAMPRGAMLPILDPRVLLPILGRPRRVTARVAGEPLPIHLWDPVAFTRRLTSFKVSDLTAVGLVPRLLFLDELGALPILRRLGAATFITAVRCKD
jgi:SAM-dependent methyltransferase